MNLPQRKCEICRTFFRPKKVYSRFCGDACRRKNINNRFHARLKSDPEFAARHKANTQRAYAKLKADPVKFAAHLARCEARRKAVYAANRHDPAFMLARAKAQLRRYYRDMADPERRAYRRQLMARNLKRWRAELQNEKAALELAKLAAELEARR